MQGLMVSIMGGRCGRDAELRCMPNGTKVCEVPVATERSWLPRDKEGNPKTRPVMGKDGKPTGERELAFESQTTWAKVQLFGARAERLAPRLTTGREVSITGAYVVTTPEGDIEVWGGKDGRRPRATLVLRLNGAGQIKLHGSD